VTEAGARAVAHCRAGNGPYLLEMKTYRYRGHSMSDPAKYRTREEVQKMREQSDPIETARRMLMEQGVGEAELKAIDDEVKAVVQDAADFSQQSPEPPEGELWTDVLVEAK
jgi:pyruvate dehydrogenase E1 component alpha subunit